MPYDFDRQTIFKQSHEKTGFLHMRKQRCRSASADQRLCFRNSDCNVEEAMIVQYELSVNLENVLRMQMKSFKESSLTNYDKTLKCKF